MAVCDPGANAPPPRGVRLMTAAELTPAMQKDAATYANDLRVPYWNPQTGAGSYRKWYGKIPVVGLVLCHSYTDRGGERTYGAYHGVTLFVATDPSMYPPAELASGPERTDVAAVAAAGGAIALVVVGFFAALRAASAERARA